MCRRWSSRRQGAAEQQFAAQLAAEAKKNGLDKTAAAHGLKAVTTDYVAKDGVIGGLSDAARAADAGVYGGQGRGAGEVSTGDGYAMFQVLDVQAGACSGLCGVQVAYSGRLSRAEAAGSCWREETNKLDDRAKVLNDLKKAAAEMNVPFKSSDLVGQDGQVPDLGAMSGPGSVAFTLPKGAISGTDQRRAVGRGAGGDGQAGADGG